jgi:hypothetical protein
MSIVEGTGRAGLVARIRGILLRPKAEWEIIDAEPATVRGLYTDYACLLAAIPAVARLISGFFPLCVLGICVHLNPIYVVAGAIVDYVLGLAGLYVTALIIDALAPSFDGQKNLIQALKVSVYAMTAAWLAGIFVVLPALSILSILGLYSFYLYYLGLPKLMKAPADKALVYTIVSILLSGLVMIVAYGVGEEIIHLGAGGGSLIATSTRAPATVTVNGATIDVAKMQAAATAAGAAASGQAGKVAPAVDPDKLKALLPDSVAGLPRTEVTAQGMGAAGVSGSNAQATYSAGGQSITLTVTDMAAMGALAAMPAAMGVQSTKETATGYEKVGVVNGQMTTEEWNHDTKAGKYGVVIASRFLVNAEGTATSMDALKSAVAAVAPDQLTSLAKG